MGEKKEVKGKINGVDVDILFETLNAMKEKPELASFKFRAHNKWDNAGHNRTHIKEFYGAGEEDKNRKKHFVLDADEPPLLLGEDIGANPVEHLLHALAACLTTSMVYHAASRGIKIDAVESRLEGDLDLRGFLGLSKDVKKGYENIRVNFTVKSDASAEKLEELSKFSPVFNVVTAPTPVTVTVEKK